MTLSDSTKAYLKAFEFLAIFVLVVWWFSRPNKSYCKDFTDYIKRERFHMVLKRVKNRLSRDTYLDGMDLKTKDNVEYFDNSGWLVRRIDTFKVGDTLIKDSGSTVIIVKRKNGMFFLHFDCDSVY